VDDQDRAWLAQQEQAWLAEHDQHQHAPDNPDDPDDDVADDRDGVVGEDRGRADVDDGDDGDDGPSQAELDWWLDSPDRAAHHHAADDTQDAHQRRHARARRQSQHPAPGPTGPTGPSEPSEPSQAGQSEPTDATEPTEPTEHGQAEPTGPTGPAGPDGHGQAEPVEPAPGGELVMVSAAGPESGRPPDPPDAPDAPDRLGWLSQVSGPCWSARALRLALDRIRHDPVLVTNYHTDSYALPKPLKRYLALRDGQCTFPGCARPASSCEGDHLIPYPRGQTNTDNLACECKHHHRAKHAYFTVTRLPDGTIRWTTPTGQHYHRHPRPLLRGW
jgi:hypothetical protein